MLVVCGDIEELAETCLREHDRSCHRPKGSASHELSIHRLTTLLRSLVADVLGERRYVFCFRLHELCAGADVVLQSVDTVLYL